jgi:hypothetical protein
MRITAARSLVLAAMAAILLAGGALASTYLLSTDATPKTTQLRKAAAPAPKPAQTYSLGHADALPRLAKPHARAGPTPPPPASNDSTTPPPNSNPASSPNPPPAPPPPPASTPSTGGSGASSGSGDTLVLE